MLRARLARRGVRTTKRPVRQRANLVALLALVCVVAGCTYNRAEPSLFDHSRTSQTTVPLLRPVTPVESAQVANPDLPVVGEAIWTSADGLDITVRIAVHGVRRVAGGTVLDWSVTPLHGPGLQPNDPVPRTFDLGLNRPGDGYPNIVLVDAARSRVYRPLTLKTAPYRCLCTPVTIAQQNLRIDHTTLLQVAFPALPNDLATVDVQFATVPAFWQVPVTPAGMLPLASYPTELTRAAEPTSVLASTRPFTYRPTGQRYLVNINAVYASRSFTSIAWTIQLLEPAHGLQSASSPPFADATPPARAYNRMSAGGPQIRLGSQLWRARLITTRLAGHGALECLCTDLRVGAAALRNPGAQLSVVTTLPPLPAEASRVDIVLPRLTTLRNVGVTRASDATFRSAGPAVRTTQFWTFWAGRPHPGWAPRDWPTPVPRQSQLRMYRATVDAIAR
jgi:hypothetical protein